MKYFPWTALTVPALTQIPTLTYMELISFPAANHLVPPPKNSRTHRFPQFLPTYVEPSVITRAGDCSPSFFSCSDATFHLRRLQTFVAEGRVCGTQTLFAAAEMGFEVGRCSRLHERQKAGRWLQSGENQSGDYTGRLLERTAHTNSSECCGNDLPQKFQRVANIE